MVVEGGCWGVPRGMRDAPLAGPVKGAAGCRPCSGAPRARAVPEPTSRACPAGSSPGLVRHRNASSESPESRPGHDSPTGRGGQPRRPNPGGVPKGNRPVGFPPSRPVRIGTRRGPLGRGQGPLSPPASCPTRKPTPEPSTTPPSSRRPSASPTPRRTARARRFTELKVASNQVVDKVRELVEDANVKRVTIQREGKTLFEIPLTVGVGAGAAALLATPVLAAVGALRRARQRRHARRRADHRRPGRQGGRLRRGGQPGRHRQRGRRTRRPATRRPSARPSGE